MTNFTSEPFGTLPTGEAVTKYTVTSEAGLSFSVMDWGATLISVNVPDRHGELREVTLGFDTLEEYVAGHPLMGSTVGRFANRIAGGGFEIDGVRYDLDSVNQQGVHIHGGKTGFAKQMWKDDEGDGGPGLMLELVSPDGHEGYPGEVEVFARFFFITPDTLRIRYLASPSRATHVNLTNHVYWNLGGRNSGEVLDHELQIRPTLLLEAEEQVPTGSVLPIDGTPFDFKNPQKIGARIGEVGKGYDHFYLAKTEDFDIQWVSMAKLYAPSSGIRLEIGSNQYGAQLYTGNYLKPPFGPHQGVCLEAQKPPNAPNEPKFPSTLVREDEVYKWETDFRFAIGEIEEAE